MTNPVNDIVTQASQGSVAAIIQVLNERLVESGVRTRAMLDDKGVLQLLCEAPTLEPLDRTILTEQIRTILEDLAPRNIRRVNINSRIVREQQLLWLEEINRNPESQVLWSEEILLKQPSFLQQIQRRSESRSVVTHLPVRSPRQLREQRQFWRGGVIGGLTAATLLLGGWVLYSKLGSSFAKPVQSDASPATNPEMSPAPNSPVPNPPTPKSISIDPFVEAVRLAEQASRSGQTATTPDEWRSLASRWQAASDLMASVPSTDGRYATAQDRVNRYRQNRQAALQRAAQP
jgi:hypothetical protein